MKNRKGFTLVEIMIVVAIIALLATIAIPNLLRARVNANDAAASALVKTISTALENYAAANGGNYPVEADLATMAADADGDFALATPPYIDPNKLVTPQFGHVIAAVSAAGSYTVSATPTTAGTTGNKIYTVTTGGVMAETDPA